MFSCVFQKLYWFRAIKLFECQENTFGIRNTQYSIPLSVHKQPNVFNTTYTIHSHVNGPNYFIHVFKSCIGFMLSNCVNEKIRICFHVFVKSFAGFVLSDCLNTKKIYLEYEIYNTAYH